MKKKKVAKYRCNHPMHPRAPHDCFSLIAASPDLLSALKRSEQALKDILGAAENGKPYTPAELQKEFIEDYNAAHAAIAKAEGK